MKLSQKAESVKPSRKKLWLSFCLLTGMAVSGQSQGELFKVDFDNYNVTAGFAKGSPVSDSFTNPDLQLRMFPGAGDGRKNGICLENSEHLSYPLKDNLNAKQGTVSLWVSPRNWKISDNGPQVFFCGSYWGKDEHFSFLIYKNSDHRITFYYNYQLPGMKKGKTLLAAASVEEKVWHKNSWHKLDAVWNSKGLMLYIDGKIAAERKIRPDENFVMPDFQKGHIMLGSKFKWKNMNLSALTGYDDLVIYSRCLSNREIREGYEKYYPDRGGKEQKNARIPVVTIPALEKQITLDGVIGADEWSDAAKIAVDRLFYKSENRKVSKSAWAWLKYDRNNLYVAMLSDRPAAKAAATVRDSQAWKDDCFEIHVTPQNGSLIYQYVLNSRNAVFDMTMTKSGESGDSKWNGTARTAVSANRHNWSAEWIIPLKDSGIKAGDPVQLNFAYLNCEKGNNQYSWSWALPGHPFGSPACSGKVLWGNPGSGIRLESFGDVPRGRLSFLINAVNPQKHPEIVTTALLQTDGTVSPVQSGNITGTPWSHTLPVGKHHLQWESKAGKAVIASGYHVFEIDKPLELSFECHGEKHYADVTVNINNAGEKVLGQLYRSGIDGEIALINSGHAVIVRQEFHLRNNAVKTIRLALPKDLKTGVYQLQAELKTPEKLSGSSEFRMPDMTPYRLKVGVDNTVPTPWTKVTPAGPGKWQVLDRIFTFGKGPLPVSILSGGNEMFAVPPAYRIVTENGIQDIRWETFKTGADSGDHVEFSGTGKSAGMRFSWTGELWFDGTYKWRMEYAPVNQPVKIRSFNLGWTMPAEFSKYVLHPLFAPWKKDGVIRLKWATAPEENTMCHILGVRKGISWWNESDANWANRKDEKQITIRKDASGKAKIDIAMISVPVTLEKTAWYTMTLTATPQRPLAKAARNYEFYGKDSELGWRREERTISGNCHIPLDKKKFRKALQAAVKRGTGIILYTCPFYLDSWEDHHAFFFHDWKKSPLLMWGTRNYANGDEPIMAESVCSGSNMFDIYAWREEQLFKEYPDLAGVYFDCCHCPECINEAHGCGGIDAFGKKYSTNTAWMLRKNLLRSLKIHRKYNRTMILHGHNKFNPIAHGFGDFWWPGEEYTTYPDNMSPVFIYCDLPDEWLQAAYNSGVRGCGVIILPENERSLHYVKNIRAKIDQDGGMELATWAHMTPFLLHDTNLCWVYLKRKDLIRKWWKIKSSIRIDQADFVGYWFKKVLTTSEPRVYASWYRWDNNSSAPYSRVIIIGNLNRTAKTFKLNIDRKAFGIERKKVLFIDLWNNRPVTEQQLQNLSLDAAHFMVLGVKEI